MKQFSIRDGRGNGKNFKAGGLGDVELGLEMFWFGSCKEWSIDID